jgi:tetratricopeptide (TPR) repeat protein
MLFITLAGYILAVADARANACSDAQSVYAKSQAPNANTVMLLQRAIALCPTHAAALNNLAVIEEGNGSINEALALYRRSIKANSQGTVAYAGLGDVLVKLGQHSEASNATAWRFQVLTWFGCNWCFAAIS